MYANNKIEIQLSRDQQQQHRTRHPTSMMSNAASPTSPVSPSSTHVKKQHPHPPSPHYSQNSGQPHGDVADCGLTMGDPKKQGVAEEGGAVDDVRVPQIVSHATDLFSLQTRPLSPLPLSAPLSGLSNGGVGVAGGGGGGGGGGSVPWSKSHLKVLVVDDAEMNRKMLAALLTRSGISSDNVADGKLAVAAVAAVPAGKLALSSISSQFHIDS